VGEGAASPLPHFIHLEILQLCSFLSQFFPSSSYRENSRKRFFLVRTLECYRHASTAWLLWKVTMTKRGKPASKGVHLWIGSGIGSSS
jgi:hypothetical protein